MYPSTKGFFKLRSQSSLLFYYLDRGYLEPFSILLIGALILCKRVVDQVKVGLADDISGQSSPFSYILSSSVSRHD